MSSDLLALYKAQKAELADKGVLGPDEYLCQAKAIAAAPPVEAPVSPASAAGTVAVADGGEGAVGHYSPEPSRHLHVHDTLNLCYRVLKTSKARGEELTEREIALVRKIAAFAPK